GSQGIFEAIEWVPRDIKTQHFSLEGELVLAVPGFLRNIDSKSRYGSAFIAAEAGEEIELALIRRLLRRLHRIHGVFLNQHQALARLPLRVKGTGFYQLLCYALVTSNQQNLTQVVTEGLESTLFPARLDDRFHYIRAHVADRAHAEADIFANSLEV